jgi:hypothetical protein
LSCYDFVVKKVPQDDSPSAKSSEFDPPHPPEETALGTAVEMAAVVAGFGALLALDQCTGGVLFAIGGFRTWAWEATSNPSTLLP